MPADNAPIYEDWATDYAALADELLARLAQGDDAFVATSALGELRSRRSPLGHPAALALLRGTAGDRHIQALAASCLIPQHLDDLHHYVLQGHLDPYIIATILGEMTDEVAILDQGDPAARRVVASLRALAAQPVHAGEASAAFLRAFAGWGGAKGGE